MEPEEQVKQHTQFDKEAGCNSGRILPRKYIYIQQLEMFCLDDKFMVIVIYGFAVVFESVFRITLSWQMRRVLLLWLLLRRSVK